jgi:hypothetical protein
MWHLGSCKEDSSEQQIAGKGEYSLDVLGWDGDRHEDISASAASG